MDRISNASEDDVRKTLAALCEDPFVHIRAVEILEKLERDRQRRAADLSTTTPDTATKRKADPDVHICIQCEKAFTESGNAPDACLYHPGDLVEGEEFLDDLHDHFSTPSVEEMFEEFPEKVDWECCEKNGPSPGCERDWHRSHPSQKTRRTAENGLTKCNS